MLALLYIAVWIGAYAIFPDLPCSPLKHAFGVKLQRSSFGGIRTADLTFTSSAEAACMFIPASAEHVILRTSSIDRGGRECSAGRVSLDIFFFFLRAWIQGLPYDRLLPYSIMVRD